MSKVQLKFEQTIPAWIERNLAYHEPIERFIIFSIPNAKKPPKKPSVYIFVLITYYRHYF